MPAGPPPITATFFFVNGALMLVKFIGRHCPLRVYSAYGKKRTHGHADSVTVLTLNAGNNIIGPACGYLFDQVRIREKWRCHADHVRFAAGDKLVILYRIMEAGARACEDLYAGLLNGLRRRRG